MLRMLYGLVFVLLVAVTLCNGAPSPKHFLVETKDEGTALKYRGRSDDVNEGTDYQYNGNTQNDPDPVHYSFYNTYDWLEDKKNAGNNPVSNPVDNTWQTRITLAEEPLNIPSIYA